MVPPPSASLSTPPPVHMLHNGNPSAIRRRRGRATQKSDLEERRGRRRQSLIRNHLIPSRLRRKKQPWHGSDTHTPQERPSPSENVCRIPPPPTCSHVAVSTQRSLSARSLLRPAIFKAECFSVSGWSSSHTMIRLIQDRPCIRLLSRCEDTRRLFNH